MPEHCRDLFQHPNQPRPMVAEAIDKDDEEARALQTSSTTPPPLAMGGKPLEGAPCLGFSCWLLAPFPPIGGGRGKTFWSVSAVWGSGSPWLCRGPGADSFRVFPNLGSARDQQKTAVCQDEAATCDRCKHWVSRVSQKPRERWL